MKVDTIKKKTKKKYLKSMKTSVSILIKNDNDCKTLATPSNLTNIPKTVTECNLLKL